MLRFITSLSLFLLVGTALRAQEGNAITPDKPIDLLKQLAEPGRKNFVSNLNPKSSVSHDPDQIWASQPDGSLRISGEGIGYIRTKQAYRDYHLVLEYKWGERTVASRTDRARDCGLLLHSYGADGAFSQSWMSSIEINVIEGGTGDFLVLAAADKDGKLAPTRAVAEVAQDRDGEWVWAKGGEKKTFPLEGKTISRINWRDRDPDWADVKGYRGAKDVENPVGEWNRLEAICKGNTIHVYLNGELVNIATDCNPSAGYIGIQSEFAQCYVRRYELFPLDSFKEKWAEETRSSDMGYDVSGESILPRRFPLSPAESQKLWKVGGDYEMQLVASEPLTCDPVDVTWDNQGRMFVAEMGDYPLPAEDGGPHLSRIRLLTDTDGDGVMDKAVTWAANLDHVQGLMPMKNGLLATTRTAILFLADTDGDNVADVREAIFEVNEPRHNQLQVSSPRYGLDNHVWLSNGLDAKEIYPESHPDQKVNVSRLNLRYDPASGKIESATGFGQFGGSLDDWNRHFFCSNRNPIMFSVMPLEAVQRNPLAGILVGHEDILPSAAPVHPLFLSHTTSSAHAGTYTAACGLGVYRGDLIPDLEGDVFVCEPTAQLVSRNHLIPNGASFKAEAVVKDRDFLTSGDEWSRPVQVRTGPDGALYVCDMYRRFIDHAMFFPEEFSKSHYMRAGLDQGRIWRLVPKGAKVAPSTTLPANDAAALVATLKSANGWIRTQAQRILVEKKDHSVVPALEQLLADSSLPKTQAHAFWTLAGLGALKAEHLKPVIEKATESGLLENALLAARQTGIDSALKPAFLDAMKKDLPRYRFLYVALNPGVSLTPETLAGYIAENPADPWTRKAIFASVPERASAVLAHLLNDSTFTSRPAAETGPVVQDFARVIAARGDLKELSTLLSQLSKTQEALQFSIVIGLSEGLGRSPLKQRSLAALIAAKLPDLGGGTTQLEAVLTKAATIAQDKQAKEDDRLAALNLVAQRPWEEKKVIAEKLISLSETPAIQTAACRLLARDKADLIGDFFFERWKTLPPAARSAALDILTSNSANNIRLMEKMKAGEISPGLMPPMARWSAGRSKDPKIHALAQEVFGNANDDRASVVEKYRKEITSLKGDATKGAAVFEKATCVTCHHIGNVGSEVGPSLNDVKIKPAEALLSDILDPNRALEERWVSQVVETKDGRTLAGLLSGEDATAVTLHMPGGVTTTIPKAEIKSLTSTGMSLMPVGLEAAISAQDMADLIAFLKKD